MFISKQLDGIASSKLSSSSGEQRAEPRPPKWQARATLAGHLASLSGAHSHVSSAEACLCPRGKKGGEEEERRKGDDGTNVHITLTLFFLLIVAIITGIPSGSLCGGERRGAPERETRNDSGAVALV